MTGYYTVSNPITIEKECSEICGDGLNLGQYECDDGNLVDGDGCSSSCKVERGFRCLGGSLYSPDKCKDLRPPTLFTAIASSYNPKNIFKFQASEEIQILSSDDPKSFVDVFIIGKMPEYIYDYELDFVKSYKEGRQLASDIDFYSEIHIKLIPSSTIIANDVHIYI